MAEDQDELLALRQAVVGLLYPSETDEPFDVFCWDASPDRPTAAEEVAAHGKGDASAREVSMEEFFGELKETETGARFEQLRRTLESPLRNLKVFRVGSRRIDVFLIGRLPSGNWAGVHTVSVET